MKYIDPTLKARIEKANQTLYENANPSMIASISRRSIPLTNKVFLERTKISDYTNVSGVSIAVRRPNINRQADRIYAAFCDDGVGKIFYADYKAAISSHIWFSEDIIPDAVDISIVFDGKMVKTVPYNKVELETSDSVPWVFWIDSEGILYGKKLHDETSLITLGNGVAVSSILGFCNKKFVSLSQGLIIFFVNNGSVFYRQYINGVWENPQQIEELPEGLTIVDAYARRTKDYRIVVQCLSIDGTLYEVFTNLDSMGLGLGYEYLTGSITELSIDVYPITHYDTFNTDTLSVGLSDLSIKYMWGLSPVCQSASNPDAYSIVLTFDHDLLNVTGQQAGFTVVDTNDTVFAVTSTAHGEDNRTLILTVNDFNNASGNMTVLYSSTTGTIYGEAGSEVPLNNFSVSFTPVGLVPTATEPPVPVAIYNIE